MFNVLEKIRETLSLIAPVIIGVATIWFELDIALYTLATVQMIESIIDWVEVIYTNKMIRNK